MTVRRMMAGVARVLYGRLRCTHIGTRLAIGLGLIFVIGSVLSIFLVYREMKQRAIAEAEQKAYIIIDRNLAGHQYINEVLKPSVFKTLKEHGVSDPAFTPEWMSSTYVIRELHERFATIRNDDYYYKECAVSARTQENEADEFEREFLIRLNADPELSQLSLVREIAGVPFVQVIKRGETIDESCLRCHGSPLDAPSGLVEKYGDSASFGRRVGEVVSAVSVRVPLAAAYAEASGFTLRLSGVLIAAFVALFLVQGKVTDLVVVRPIRRLKTKAAEIASDDAHLGETIGASSTLELQELASAFNSMSVKLREVRDSLKGTISSQTSEITAAAANLVREKEQLVVTLCSIGDAVISIDTDGKVVLMNPVAEALTGFTQDEAAGRPINEVFTALDANTGNAVLDLDGSTMSTAHDHLILVSRDGVRRSIAKTASPIRKAEGGVTGTVLVFRDISEQKAMQARIAESEERFRLMAETAQDLVFRFRVSPGRSLEYVSPSVTGITGYAPEEFYSDPDLFIGAIHPEDRHLIEAVAADLSLPAEPVAVRWVSKNGSTLWMEHRSTLIRDEERGVTAIQGIARDITARKLAEDRIRYLSFHDSMTGLYNRAFCEEELSRMDTQTYLPFSLIMADMNGLKLVNDSLGHSAGDKQIVAASRVLEESCRRSDVVVRWGGDEFVIILPNTPSRAAHEVVSRIRARLEQGEPGLLTPSLAIGVATRETMGQTMDDLITTAENHMYRDKLAEGKSLRSSIIASLRKTLSEKTHETEEHCARLRRLALDMGHALELPDSETRDLSLLCVLHDIGKLGVPDHLIEKPGPLTEEEWEVMKTHPEIGCRIVQSSYELAHLGEAVLSHHERWDGKGYPSGLMGTEIPLISRIISIVDAYDVMTHARPYKPPISSDEAIAEIRRCAGTQFDPKLVDLFVGIVEAQGAQ